MPVTGADALLIGYGNPGRGDDGLGPAFARRIAARHLPSLAIDIDYQLTVDHAAMIATATTVIFADAATDADGPFYFRPVSAGSAQSLGSHSVSPEAALALARLLFGAAPRGFVLGLAGSSFGAMAEGLSATAEHNLDLAEQHFLRWFADGCRAPATTAHPSG